MLHVSGNSNMFYINYKLQHLTWIKRNCYLLSPHFPFRFSPRHTSDIDNFKSDTNASDLSEQLSLSPQPSNQYSTFMPNIYPKLSSDQTGAKSTWTIMASLEISLWPQEIQSPMQFCHISYFESQIHFSYIEFT